MKELSLLLELSLTVQRIDQPLPTINKMSIKYYHKVHRRAWTQQMECLVLVVAQSRTKAQQRSGLVMAARAFRHTLAVLKQPSAALAGWFQSLVCL